MRSFSKAIFALLKVTYCTVKSHPTHLITVIGFKYQQALSIQSCCTCMNYQIEYLMGHPPVNTVVRLSTTGAVPVQQVYYGKRHTVCGFGWRSAKGTGTCLLCTFHIQLTCIALFKIPFKFLRGMECFSGWMAVSRNFSPYPMCSLYGPHQVQPFPHVDVAVQGPRVGDVILGRGHTQNRLQVSRFAKYPSLRRQSVPTHRPELSEWCEGVDNGVKKKTVLSHFELRLLLYYSNT